MWRGWGRGVVMWRVGQRCGDVEGVGQRCGINSGGHLHSHLAEQFGFYQESPVEVCCPWQLQRG